MRKLHLHPCGNYHERYEQEQTVFTTDYGRVWTFIGVLILLTVIPFIASPYMLYVLNLMAIASIATIGLNILIGFTGQISLGHGAFFGVGAYTAAILATRFDLPLLAAVPAAGMMTALIGVILGIPSGRLKGLYLTIATLAGQFIIEYILIHWESLTKGTMGITLPPTQLLGISLKDDIGFYYLMLIALGGMIWIAINLMRTRYGRAFIAIRDNDRAAEGMGIPIFRYKLLSFAISSFYAGFAGALWAFYMGSITAEPFNLGLSVEYIAMVIIGGLGSISGSIYGAVFITLLNEILRYLTEILMNTGVVTSSGLNMAPLREFTFGLAIVLFILFEPRGLSELWRIIRSSFRLWPFSY